MITHELLSNITHIKHGFFTRKNGYSSGIYSSLNCGFGSSDDADNIKKNYDYVSGQIGADSINICHQIHSNKVIIIDKNHDFGDRKQADALVTNKPNIAIGVLTADCSPVLFADKKKKIIGAAHIGRKGAFSDIFTNVIKSMNSLGSDNSDICAVMGPAISKDNYEVSQDIFDEINNGYQEYLQHIYKTPNKENSYHLDVGGIIAQQAQRQNINFVNIERYTYSQPEYFFSYRRSTHQNEPDYGRLIHVIMLQE